MQAKSSVVGQEVKIILNNLKRSHIEDIHCNPLHGKSWQNDFLQESFWRSHIQGIDRLAKMTNDSEQEDRWSDYTLHRSSSH